MPEVHDTAILRGEVDLADDVEIGPGSVLDGTLGRVTVGAGTRVVGNAWLYGPITIGARNRVYPFTCLGFAPQSVKYDPATPGCGVTIGDGNTFREHVTVHRAMTGGGPTTIGAGCLFMVGAHAGHDCRIGDHAVLANDVALGGHVRVDEHVTVGGGTVVHQFCRLGRGAMLSGGIASPRDVPPFFMLTGINVAGSLNLVGMRRLGLAPDEVEDVRWAYRTLYRRGLPVAKALEELKTRAQRPIIAEYVEFIEGSHRGLSRGHGQTLRNPETPVRGV